jgi:selenocysteine-specific elongation factor
MIVATAGHVDHGKTSLVQALTGVDTDTLAEEKKRGLTIDIGFAYLPLCDFPSIGFIDVPGHERFIRNALCGLAAADFVLLLVAADDGPMPQTREHLAIIDLLGIQRGAIVISKIDSVPSARVDAVRRELAMLRANTELESWPIFELSAVSGEGVDVLRKTLQAKAEVEPIFGARVGSKAKSEARPVAGVAVGENTLSGEDVENHFRMPLDRAFDIKGAGLVVTGTIFAGSVAVGDTVSIAGSNLRLRVRGLRVHDDEQERGHSGQRCAINLAGSGLRKEQISRGDWITSPQVTAPIQRFDAEIKVVNDSLRPLRHWTPVHLHLGAAETTARVAVLDGGAIAPGKQGLVQLVSDHAIGATYGDRFIIRDQSARHTLGGGRVLDIFPPRRGRAHAERLVWLQQMKQEEPMAALRGLLESSDGGVDLAQFVANRNLAGRVQAEIMQADERIVLNIAGAQIGFSQAVADAHAGNIIQALERCHQSQPQAHGFSLAELIGQLERKLSRRLLEGFIELLQQRDLLKIDATGYALCAQQADLNPLESEQWQLIESALSDNGLRPMTLAELMQTTQISQSQLKPLIERLNRVGRVVKLSSSLLVLAPILGELQALIGQLQERSSDGIFSVAEFRDDSGIGRNRCIEILESFDARGITRRSGSGRCLLPSADSVFAKLRSSSS